MWFVSLLMVTHQQFLPCVAPAIKPLIRLLIGCMSRSSSWTSRIPSRKSWWQWQRLVGSKGTLVVGVAVLPKSSHFLQALLNFTHPYQSSMCFNMHRYGSWLDRSNFWVLLLVSQASMMMTRPSTRDKLITSWWVQQRRDLYYLGFILLLVIYHQYTTHSTLLQNSQFLSAMEPETWRNVETLSSSSSSLSRYNESTTTMDLSQLTKSSITSCPPPLLYIPNYHGHSSTTNGRKIPYTIHMTSKSRCFSTNFYDNIQFWRTLAPTIQQRGEQQGQEQQQQQQQHPYSIYLHDDDAVNRLLSQNWELFPHMNLARKCLRSGAGLADLWRYLVLWEYGGIYTGMILYG